MPDSIPFSQRLRARPNFWALLISSSFLLLVGFTLMSSASSVESIRLTGGSFHFTLKQGAAIGVGLFFLYVIVRFINYRVMRVLASFWVIGTFGLLLFVMFFGKTVDGQRNWVELGFFDLQPSEMAKLAIPALVAWIAALANQHRWSDTTRWFLMSSGVAGMILPVVIGRDLGNPLVLATIGLVSFAIAEMPPKWLAGITFSGLIGVTLLIFLGPSWKSSRITDWLSPEADPMGGGYQLLHGQYALASGGVFGNGIGSSIEKWGALPAAHTDFILPIIAEETGLIGTLSLLTALSVLIFTAFRIGQSSREIMGKLIGAGVGTWLGVQTIINVGGVTGLLPITGLPLPFVSYGGTSMVMLGIAIGILFVIENDNHEIRELAQIDRQTVR